MNCPKLPVGLSGAALWISCKISNL